MLLQARSDVHRLRAFNRFNVRNFSAKASGPGMATLSIVFRADTDCRNNGQMPHLQHQDWAYTFDRMVRKSKITPEYIDKLVQDYMQESKHEYLRDQGIEVHDIHTHRAGSVKWYEHKVSSTPINLRRIRA
jgi:hypothetical protein